MKDMEEFPQDRLELALKASNEGIWDWVLDEDGGSIYYSERNLEFLGAKKDNAPHLFLNPEPWIDEEDLEDFNEELRKVKKQHGKYLFVIDCRYQRPDGIVIWLRIRGASVRDDEGNLIRLAGSMIEITRRKVAESQLAEERHRLMTLIENVPVNVYFKDADSRFVMANTATALKLGAKSVEEIIGKNDHDFFDQRHADKSRQDEEMIMTTGHEQNESLEHETWDDKEDSWVITTKMPWVDHRGKVKGVFGMTNDVTNLVKTQRQLMDMTYKLKTQNESVQEELQLAQEIQLSMLQEDQIKSLPSHHENCNCQVNFAYRYAPASGLAGDFYQVIPISKTQVGLFMCDVMGHGVRSALIVSMLRGLMEKERDSVASPEWFIYALNQGLVSILQRAGVTMFATAFYAILDMEKKTLKYANAGHPSPIVVGEGKASRLSDIKKVAGPALGLVEECAYAVGEINFKNFKKLFLFTDGIYETENEEGEEMGFERMMGAVNCPDSSVEQDLDRLLAETHDFAGDGEFGDDVCLLGVELKQCQ